MDTKSKTKLKTSSSSDVYIVSCTRKKYWDMFETTKPKMLPAKDAYKGSTFLRWLRWLQYIEQKNDVTWYMDDCNTNNCEAGARTVNPLNHVKWYIFSSKYGIIEPDYLIENYDIHFIRDSDKAIPEHMLLRQIIKYGIHKAKNVYFVGSDDYYDKLKRIFEKAGIVLRRFRFSNSS